MAGARPLLVSRARGWRTCRLPCCSADRPVSRLVHEHVMSGDDHAFPVLDSGRLSAIVTLEELCKMSRDAWDATTVREIMTPADQLTVVTPDEDAAEAPNRLSQHDVGRMPVLRNARLVGLSGCQELVKWLQLHAQLFGG
jgi:CBS domain-containing protein